MELTQFEHEFVIVVIRYLTPMLMYLLYSRLTITTILLSFRRVKRQLRKCGDDSYEATTWNIINDAYDEYWPSMSKAIKARAVVEGFKSAEKSSTAPGILRLIRQVASHKSGKTSSVKLVKQLRRMLHMLVPPDVIRFARTFHRGISASKAPLGRHVYY